MTKIKIDSIVLDHAAQPRAELNSEVIGEYAEAMKAGAQFPPVIVFGTNGTHWLADGWHRVNAAKVARLAEIDADVRVGDKRDAVLFSCGANATNGMRRTNADKRRAVLALLHDPEWSKWSDREIARRCGVNHHLVAELRAELTGSSPSDTRQYTTKHGTTATMHTENIGARQTQEPTIEPTLIPRAELAPTKAKPTFNRTNDNIEWAWWSWNPVTGCEFGCDYCYARDIANRFYPEGFKPTFHPDRLEAPANTNPVIGESIGGKNVFVCSMADLFGSWVPNEWISQIMRQVESNPQWNFLFLTKNPRRLTSVKFPDNAWVGVTVDTQARVKAAEDSMHKTVARVKWLSCEPMMERLTFSRLEVFQWIVIGGASASTQTPEYRPPFDDIVHLYQQARAAGCKVYFKTNLLGERVREYPNLV